MKCLSWWTNLVASGTNASICTYGGSIFRSCPVSSLLNAPWPRSKALTCYVKGGRWLVCYIGTRRGLWQGEWVKKYVTVFWEKGPLGADQNWYQIEAHNEEKRMEFEWNQYLTWFQSYIISWSCTFQYILNGTCKLYRPITAINIMRSDPFSQLIIILVHS